MFALRGHAWILALSSACALASSLGVAEVLLRAVDPYGISYFAHLRTYDGQLQASAVPGLLFEHRPGACFDAGVPVRINALGLRGGEVARAPAQGVRRVLVVGDSVAFGWGVREEDTFSRVLEAGLDQAEVLNAGVVHYDTRQERLWLEARGLALAPDLVVLIYCHNDLLVADAAPLRGRSSPRERPPELAPAVTRLDWWLLTNAGDSRLAHFARFATLKRVLEPGPGGASAEQERSSAALLAYLESAQTASDLAASLDDLGRIARACRAHGAALVVVPYGAPAAVAERCAAEGVPFVARAGKVYADPSLRISAVDPHPNAAGQRVLANATLAALEVLGLPEPRE